MCLRPQAMVELLATSHSAADANIPRRRTQMFAHIRPFKFAAVLAAASLFSSVGVASPAAPCGSHDALIKSLTIRFKEARRIMGVVNAKSVMEIFMSPQGTWTVLVTDTTGTACVIATGQDWQEVPIEMTGLDS
jgi:hypothetical protein